MVGTPYLIDANMFQWGRREFARVCVRLKLHEKLPLGIWVEGSSSKFYQKIEYERIPNFCYNCGFIGHLKSNCNNGNSERAMNMEDSVNTTGNLDVAVNAKSNGASRPEANVNVDRTNGYGPWLQVYYGKNKLRKSVFKKTAMQSDTSGRLDSKVNLENEITIERQTEVPLGNLNNCQSQILVSDKQGASSSKVNTLKSNVINKFSILDQVIEEGELVDIQDHGSLVDNKLAISGSPGKMDVRKNFENSKVEIQSSKIGKFKKKSSKLSKNLGPMRLLTRNRRLEGESSGTKEMKNFLACNDFHEPAFVGPRFTWCNNKSGEEIILERLDRWNVSNGKSIDVFKDIWILDKCIDLWPTFVVVPEVDELLVDHFILNGGWDVNGLLRFFGTELVNLICKVKIRDDLVVDEMELIHFKPGRTISALVKETIQCSLVEESKFFWIGKINLNPRVEIFWWRMLNNAIPTNLFLSYRRLQDKRECNWCVGSNEDIAHIVIACKITLVVVNILNCWGFGIPSFQSLDDCLSSGNWDANQNSLFNHWHPPPPDWIKVNVDAALLPNNKAGIAAVFRDHKGRFLLAAGRDIIHWDASKLELMARDCNKLADLCASYAILGSFIWEDISSLEVPPSFVKLLKEESGIYLAFLAYWKGRPQQVSCWKGCTQQFLIGKDEPHSGRHCWKNAYNRREIHGINSDFGKVENATTFQPLHPMAKMKCDAALDGLKPVMEGIEDNPLAVLAILAMKSSHLIMIRLNLEDMRISK
ncbi:hypothetical protein M5K25_027621 [Dendrobium thyrsiflorum]|uniref:CCHC-type domain-containing protein n=1 Tax=Dendrobium thyrsiflorum TaxID=117978 RepID=A0ABD0TUB9_DENTH